NTLAKLFSARRRSARPGLGAFLAGTRGDQTSVAKACLRRQFTEQRSVAARKSAQMPDAVPRGDGTDRYVVARARHQLAADVIELQNADVAARPDADDRAKRIFHRSSAHPDIPA